MDWMVESKTCRGGLWRWKRDSFKIHRLSTCCDYRIEPDNLNRLLIWFGNWKETGASPTAFSVWAPEGGWGGLGGFLWGVGGCCRAHSNPNPSIQKCRTEGGKPYTIHHRARLHREESSMATSHLKSGQIQQQEHTRGGRGGGWGEKKREGGNKMEGDKRRPGWKHKASKVLLFPLGDWMRRLHRAQQPPAALSVCVRACVCVGSSLNLESGQWEI